MMPQTGLAPPLPPEQTSGNIMTALRPLLALTLALSTAGIAQAFPVDNTPKLGTPSKDLTGVSPANLAGIVNYCIELNYLGYDEGEPTLNALIDKSNAVPKTQDGNFDYALGTAGHFDRQGSRYDMAALSTADRTAACHNALTVAKPMM